MRGFVRAQLCGVWGLFSPFGGCLLGGWITFDLSPSYSPKKKLSFDSPVEGASLVYMGLVNPPIFSPRLFTSLPSNSYITSEDFSDWLNTAGVSPILDLFSSSLPLPVPLPPTPTYQDYQRAMVLSEGLVLGLHTLMTLLSPQEAGAIKGECCGDWVRRDLGCQLT